MQHGSVPRGALMRLLTEYGGVKPFRLEEILRQKNAGRTWRRHAALRGQDRRRLRRAGHAWAGSRRSATIRPLPARSRPIICRPSGREEIACWWCRRRTREAARITAAIRRQLREAGKLGGEEREFTRLVQVDASEAEREQAGRATSRATCCSSTRTPRASPRASGSPSPIRRRCRSREAGEILRSTGRRRSRLAAGDGIRFTGTVKTLDGDHTLKNGDDQNRRRNHPGGNIRLDNGWVVGKDAGHFRAWLRGNVASAARAAPCSG